jgi:hypothetical protein
VEEGEERGAQRGEGEEGEEVEVGGRCLEESCVGVEALSHVKREGGE